MCRASDGTLRARAGLPVPKVVAGKGTEYSGGWCSYAAGYQKIVLTRSQRTVAVLLHELVHTFGFGTHGKKFVRKYIELLVEYAGCNEGELRLALGLFNVNH